MISVIAVTELTGREGRNMCIERWVRQFRAIAWR